MEKQLKVKEIQNVEGLYLIPQIITKVQQEELVKLIYQENWNTTLKRRTQHYGFQYSYLLKNTVKKAQQIPQWMVPVKNKIEDAILQNIKLKQTKFDQVIINQYQPGQGISPHTDNTQLFGDIVASLSLASPAVMLFDQQIKYQPISQDQAGVNHNFDTKNSKTMKQQFKQQQIALKRRSAIILTGPARYEWKHSIPARKKDDGVSRSTRVSLTFRTMKSVKQVQ